MSARRFIPVALAIAVGGVIGVFGWRHFNQPPTSNPPEEIVHKNLDFAATDFLHAFDVDGNGRVTLDEFKQRYGKPMSDDLPPLIFHKEDGGPALTAEEAFARWDRDANGYVDAADIELITDKAWAQFSAQAVARKLRPVRYKEHQLALNFEQLKTMDAETGALSLKQLPWAGRYFDAAYFTTWVRVTRADGTVIEGFGTHKDGKLWLLQSDTKLTVHDKAGIEITVLEDAPQSRYARKIAETPFDATALNLALARECREWGLLREAGMLYARVLLFEPRNQEALDALGFTERDGHFFPKVK